MSKQNVTLNIEGMTCSNCAMGISRYLEKQGMQEVSVNFSTQEATFDIQDRGQLPRIVKGIEGIGYKVRDEEDNEHHHAISGIEKKFIATLFFTLPLFTHMFFPRDSWINIPVVQLALCLPVFIIGVMHFGRSGWGSLKTGVPNMDVLIFMGITASFGYSLYGLIMEMGYDYLFFETAATITTLVLLGNVIEHRSVRQTSGAIQALSKLQPTKAVRVIQSLISSSGESTEEIEHKDIEIDDTLLVNTGESVPTDGTIIWGQGTMNESMISGESIPVEKNNGEHVIGGTIVELGSFKMKATAVGEETVLSRIIELVKKAQAEKPDIQRLADKISQYFVPIVIFIAIATFLVAYLVVDLTLQKALLNSVAILVIACPCAMGLATPTAVMVGIGRAARTGILIKGGATLEVFSKVKKVIFDKTGTLTTGDFEVDKLQVLMGSEEEAISILASLERHSAHPIAVSVVRAYLHAPTIEFVEVKEEKGVGVTATAESGHEYRAGSYKIAEGLTTAADHNVYVVKNNELIATLDLTDKVKPGAAELMTYLKSKGITPVMLSGDKRERCLKVATELGIDEVHAEMNPMQKLEVVETMTKDLPTAMVGDGVNDAPALAKATIGVSLSNATQVAIHSASIILLRGDLRLLRDAFQVSEHTLRTIRQNLFWAFFYNVIAIPVAAIGLLTPMVAALSMAFSDVFVIGNSIRLGKKRLD